MIKPAEPQKIYTVLIDEGLKPSLSTCFRLIGTTMKLFVLSGVALAATQASAATIHNLDRRQFDLGLLGAFAGGKLSEFMGRPEASE